MNFRLFFIVIFLFISGANICSSAEITDEAQQLYEKHQQSVFQIQVIDLATGKKNGLGSGFQLDAQGHIATNFHVLSEAIHSPQRFRVEYIRFDGSVGTAAILDIDVIHDLAIIKGDQEQESFLELGESSLSNGAKIFSMGNPYDLGMTIMEGTYNGLMEKSLYKKILFSGSINPGMSGGPVLNHDAKVIGVNVATQGNEISFLVPVEYLKELYDRLTVEGDKPPSSWNEQIEEQLVKNQDRYMDEIISSQWDTLPIGKAVVPGEISGVFKCWGESKDKEDELYTHAEMNCSSLDDIYLSSAHYTGHVLYRYYWLKSKGLNVFRFYNLFEDAFSYSQYHNAYKEDATNFQCQTDFVKIADQDWKVGFCARNYKKYPKLFDVNVSMASVNELDKGLQIELILLGISKDKALEFAKKFMKVIQWPK